jgi:hypothetical protein
LETKKNPGAPAERVTQVEFCDKMVYVVGDAMAKMLEQLPRELLHAFKDIDKGYKIVVRETFCSILAASITNGGRERHHITADLYYKVKSRRTFCYRL